MSWYKLRRKHNVAAYIQLRLQKIHNFPLDNQTIIARGKLIDDWLISTRDVDYRHYEVNANQLEQHYLEYLQFAEYLMVNQLMKGK